MDSWTHTKYDNIVLVKVSPERERQLLLLGVAFCIFITSLQSTLKEYLERWIETKKQTIKPTTYNFYSQHVKLISEMIGDIQINKLKPIHIQEFCNELLSREDMNSNKVTEVSQIKK